MPSEIERKFLLNNNNWKIPGKEVLYKQGYILAEKEKVVRVRTAGKIGFITIKGPVKGYSRLEYEYTIPLKDADELLEFFCAKPIIQKLRTVVDYKGIKWEVDEFLGENEGLFIAEAEVPYEGFNLELPDWAGEEVTGDKRYYNSYLVSNRLQKLEVKKHEKKPG